MTVATAKLAESVGKRPEYKHCSCKNSPVGIGKVTAVLEGHDKDNCRNHHWDMRQGKRQNQSDGASRTDPVNDRDKDLSYWEVKNQQGPNECVRDTNLEYSQRCA